MSELKCPDCWEAMRNMNRRAPEAGQPELVENLAMLLRRFISLSRPIDESSALQNLSKQALDFLARHSLSGNLLRDMAAESEAQPEAGQELVANWYLGSQNDILYILDGKPCQGNDHPIHDHGPNALLRVPAGREAEEFAKHVVELHNKSLYAQPQRPAVPDAKPLPDVMLASYHEAVGWNACREAMLTTAPAPERQNER